MTTEQNFYLLPSRLFEFAAGGMVALFYSMTSDIKRKKCFSWVMALAALMAIVLVSNIDMDAMKVRLLATVTVTTVFVVMAENDIRIKWQSVFKPIAMCGTASFSLYLFHQLIFAFYRYAFNDQFTVLSYIVIVVCALTVGFVLFYLLERPLGKYVKGDMKHTYTINALCVVALCGLSIMSLHFYKQNGMTRDIPELNMYVGKNSETPEDYNGRAFAFDKDFENNGKTNVLVIGDSFGRDWINVLLESGMDSVTNISYYTEPDEICVSRIKKADYVFIANNTLVYERYARIIPLAMQKHFYRVGRKSYGSWIGIVYNNNRYGKNYFTQKVPEKAASIETTKLEREIFGDKFIDMMTPLKDKDGMISIFDDKGKLITQDGIHITKAGAQKYAKILNVKQYFE